MAVKRVLAVVIAVALIAGAIVIRRFIDDGGELSLGGASSRIYCDEAIGEACEAAFGDADLVVEPPGRTLARFLDDTDDGAAVWIAADLWFDILASEQERVRTPDSITDTSAVLAHSPLVVAADDCPEVSWTCVAALDGTLGTGDLDSSIGLATEVQLVVTALGSPTFATNDPGFGTWKGRVSVEVRTSPNESALLGTYLNSPGVFDAIALTKAAVDELAVSGRTTDAQEPTDPGPDLAIRAVGINSARLPGALDDLTDRLVDLGWSSGIAPEADRPSGGAMQALRS